MDQLGAFYLNHEILADEGDFSKRLQSYIQRDRNYQLSKSIGDTLPINHEQLTILDFGCNIGLLLRYLQEEKGCKVAGVEINQKAAAFARTQLHTEDIFPDIEHIPESMRFDIITLIDVIEHVPDPVGLLQALRRLLKPSGQIFFRLPVTDGVLFSKKAPESWKWVYAPYHLSMFSINAISRAGTACGYQVTVTNDLDVHFIPPFVADRLEQDLGGWWRVVPRRIRNLAIRALLRLFGNRLRSSWPSDCVFVTLKFNN